MRQRVPILVAILTALLDLWGALITTNTSLPTPDPNTFLAATAHQHTAMAIGLVCVALLLWYGTKPAFLIAGGFLLQAVASFIHPVFHATLAHALVAATIALAYAATSTHDPEYVRDYGWPSMRSLAIAIPLFTLIQAALGAAFRQRLLGLMPHVIGAMIVSILILMLGFFVLSQFPNHPRLRPASRAMLTVMFAQVFLGIAAFTMRAVPDLGTAATLTLVGAHVITGAFTLAATVVLGMLIRREVQPKL